jgi:hypothetical protein
MFTVIFFWAKLVRNGRIRAVKFRPKKFGRNFADLGEIHPNQQIFGWDIGQNSPKPKKNRPQILRQNLIARIRPFSGEQELQKKLFEVRLLSSRILH